MAKADVSANVTLFGQKNGDFCGEANAEMARYGYPDSGDRVRYDQCYLFNNIEARKTMTPGDMGKWSTDPQALSECLQSLSVPPVNWVVFARADRDEVQQFIMDCIEKTRFPMPVVTRHGRHWVLVVGWRTKVPAGGGSPVLWKMHIYNPKPVGKGLDIWVAAKMWNSSRYFSEVGGGEEWLNKYVAVGQGS